ncbi:Heat stress transcription factor A-6b [Linum perenne]
MNPSGRGGGGTISGSSSSSSTGGGGGGGGAPPQPVEGLHDAGPPPFLTKTYEIVDDSATNQIVSWSSGNNSFVVWDPQAFSLTLLPKYFKHNNFSSFVRQLNTYGFRKVDPDRWEFANEGFLRGQKHLLKHIRRRKTPPQSTQQQGSIVDPCVEVGRFGIESELERLQRDKQVLMMELVKLRNQQQTTKACLQMMEERLRRNEARQQQMMTFLARAVQNPDFLQQLVHQKEIMRELESAIITKKKRRHIDQAPTSTNYVEVEDSFVKIEPREEFGRVSDLDISELDSVALDIERLSGFPARNMEMFEDEGAVEGDEKGGGYFWEDLLNDVSGQEMGFNMGGGDEEDGDDCGNMDVLVQQLGFLGNDSL